VDFVADYSCEGSGGFAPRFPNTCGVSGCQCGLTEAELASMPDVISGRSSAPRAHDSHSTWGCKADKL